MPLASFITTDWRLRANRLNRRRPLVHRSIELSIAPIGSIALIHRVKSLRTLPMRNEFAADRNRQSFAQRSSTFDAVCLGFRTLLSAGIDLPLNLENAKEPSLPQYVEETRIVDYALECVVLSLYSMPTPMSASISLSYCYVFLRSEAEYSVLSNCRR